MFRVLGRERSSNGIGEMDIFGLLENGLLIPRPIRIIVHYLPFFRFVGNFRRGINIPRVRLRLFELRSLI